jgi:hypothetical protein
MFKCRQVLRWTLNLCLALILLGGSAGYSQSTSSTHGVNYEFADTTLHPDYISFAHLSFSANAVVGAAQIPVTLQNNPVLQASTCSGPCNATAQGGNHHYLNCTTDKGEADCRLDILRFAQYGRVTDPIAFNWAVVMAEGESLTGTMHAALDSTGALVYPASAELGGRMVVTVHVDGQPQPVVLRSRKEPKFQSQILGWPPYGSEFVLSNPPIPYYRASEIDDPAAEPFMVVTSNNVVIGTQKAAFFEKRPKILAVTSTKDGLDITWEETAGTVPGITIARYHLYRNLTPGTLSGWQMIATVPAGTSSYVDRSVPSGVPVDYVISHATDYPFGIEYEGIFDPPATYRP